MTQLREFALGRVSACAAGLFSSFQQEFYDIPIRAMIDSNDYIINIYFICQMHYQNDERDGSSSCSLLLAVES